MAERCGFHHDHAPDLTPRGKRCRRRATHVIYWRDGRWSPSCNLHGLAALDELARRLVARVEALPERMGARHT